MFKVYGKKGCGYCKKAVTLLDVRDQPHQYYDIEEMPEHEFDDLITGVAAGMRTVPIILENDQLIGGYDELIVRLS